MDAVNAEKFISDQVKGKTIRLIWNDGPTAGATHEHLFSVDGTVQWRALKNGKSAADGSEEPAKKPAGDQKSERARYAAMKIDDDVCLVSYLSQSGYTLTVALNFRNWTTVGTASNDRCWFPVHGEFEVVA